MSVLADDSRTFLAAIKSNTGAVGTSLLCRSSCPAQGGLPSGVDECNRFFARGCRHPDLGGSICLCQDFSFGFKPVLFRKAVMSVSLLINFISTRAYLIL